MAEAREVHDPRTEASRFAVEAMRRRLLDVSKANALVSFKHSDRSRTHVRIVDAAVGGIYDALRGGRTLKVLPLPEPDEEPADERTETFQIALDAAMLADEAYAEEIAQLDENADDHHARLARAERRLKDRIRDQQGLPPRTREAFSLRDHADEHGIRWTYDLDGEGDEPEYLQTLLLPREHDRKMGGVRDIARTALDDMGVNTLHVAFGFLEWFESEDSDRPIISPLLLMAAAVQRQLVGVRYVHSVSAADDDLVVNETLSERLVVDRGVGLPAFDPEGGTLAYFDMVEEAFAHIDRRWRVRRFVTLGHFAFSRIAMWRDLDPADWPDGIGVADSELVADMLGGSADRDDGQASFAAEYDVEAAEERREIPLLIADADSSQHSAVIDAHSGRSLVIEGPPGTGKSQTITNIIAAALAANRSVLFVAEKMPALQVVKSRLDSAGLGDFCLELHSNKTRRRDVVDSLRTRLERGRPTRDDGSLERSLEEMTSLRARLRGYSDALNRVLVGETTVHDALWGDRTRRSGEDPARTRKLDAIELPEALTAGPERFAALRETITAYEGTAATVTDAAGSFINPWAGASRSDILPVDSERIADKATRAAQSATRAARIAVDGAPVVFDEADTIHDWRRLAVGVGDLLAILTSQNRPHRGLASEETLAALRTARGRYDRLEEIEGDLRSVAIDPSAEDKLVAVKEIARLLSVLPKAPAESTRGGDLGRVVAEHAAAAATLRSSSDLIEQASQLLGIQSGSVNEARIVALSLDRLRALHVAAPGYALPELLEARSAAPIAEFARRIDDMNLRAKQLRTIAAVPFDADPATLRLRAAALERTGFFAFLNGSVREARRYWSTVGGTAKRNPTVLRDWAALIDERTTAESDPAFREAHGRRWLGLATDVSAAAAVAEWGVSVRATLVGHAPAVLAARGTLLRHDAEVVEALTSMAKSPEAAVLLELTADDDRDVAEIAREYETASEATSGLHERIVAARLGEFEIEALRAAGNAVDERKVIAIALSNDVVQAHGHGSAGFDIAVLDRSIRVAEALAALPQKISAEIDATPRQRLETLVAATAGIDSELQDYESAWEMLREACGFPADHPAAPSHASAAKAGRLLAAAGDDPAALSAWTRYLHARERAHSSGMGALVDGFEAGEIRGEPLPDVLDRVRFRTLARHAFETDAQLARFDGSGQDQARSRFTKLDRELMDLQRRSIADKLLANPIPRGTSVGRKSEWTELSLIENETSKRQRHISVRDLVRRSRRALVAMKPCFMMSPLTVAQILPRTGLKFDLLVIDEASQMRPEDALGAMARAKQVVIVGDPKQLPPSKFFAVSGADAADEDEDAVTAESILDLGLASFRPARRLRWHYRSRHGSLIAFSNRHFYDNDLVVFPSPGELDETAGVTMRYVEEGLYRNRSNAPEAEVVCREALEFIRRHPERSLGIVAINAVQTQIIRDEMDVIFSENPDAEEWRLSWAEGLEPFFVKNLENVQGDERDAIFISTVYGKAPDGRVSNQFGEIVRGAGHRRLNVLFTRAKQAMRLFTSLRPEDVRVGSSSSEGVRALHEFLRFAASGRLEGGRATGAGYDSDFEAMVSELLLARGYKTVPQVGVSGFRIDLGVPDRNDPSNFLLGIECDGAAYHSSKSARDRDRLRQQVLEGLGWTLYRIWSTDWYRDPRAETDRLVEFVERLQRKRDAERAERPTTPPTAAAMPARRPSGAVGGEVPKPAAPKSNALRPTPSKPTMQRPSAPKPAPTPPPGEDDRPALIKAVRSRIDAEIGPVPEEAHLLRVEIVRILLAKSPENRAGFLSVVPMAMRQKIDPRHMAFLEDVLDALE